MKTLDEYYDALDRDELPVLRGIELTADDLLRRAIIQALMCHFELSMRSIEIAYLINFREYFAEELADLQDMEGRPGEDRRRLDQCAAGRSPAGARHRDGSTASCAPTRAPALLAGDLNAARIAHARSVE